MVKPVSHTKEFFSLRVQLKRLFGAKSLNVKNQSGTLLYLQRPKYHCNLGGMFKRLPVTLKLTSSLIT